MVRRNPVRLRAGTATSLRRMTASTMVDLALVFRRSPRAAGHGGKRLPSGSQEALNLALGPNQGLVHRLALQMAHDHLGMDRLHVDLEGDLGWRRRCCDRQRLVVVRVGIVV